MKILLLCPKDQRECFQDLIDRAVGDKPNLHIYHNGEQAAKVLDSVKFDLVIIVFGKNFPDNWDLESLAKAKNIRVLTINIVHMDSNPKAIIERIANHSNPARVQ